MTDTTTAGAPEAPEDKKPWVYVPKADDELKKLADDIVEGRVFTDAYHIRDASDIPMVFMFIALCDREQIDAMQANKIVMLYEYLDKAGPRSVNGYPCFFSAQMLNFDDAQKVHGYLQKIQQAKKDMLASL